MSQLSADVSNAIDSLIAISGLIPARPLMIEDKVLRLIPKPSAAAVTDIPRDSKIGAGDSDLTWQAIAGVGFKASSWADIALTYRYLKWEFDDGPVDDLSFSGPMLGVVFRF